MGGRASAGAVARAVDNYRANKYNVAPRVAAALAKVDRKRVRRATRSLYDFLCVYGPGTICDYAPPREMRPLLDDMERCADSVGGRYQILMSRGFGKTTFVGGLAVYRLVRGASHFVEIVAATDGKATDVFDTVTGIFTAEPFATDFPEVAVPYAESGGNSVRMMRQNWNGRLLGMERSKGRFILPTVPDSALSGAKIVIRSFTAKDLRGLNIRHERPDFVILDDIQTDEMAANPEQIAKAVRKINGTIRGQFAHHRPGTMLMTATPIFPGDVAERIKDDPGWITKVYPMMLSMPKNRELWEEYGKAYREEIAAAAAGKRPKTTATAFYRRRRREMDEGAEPQSPHVYVRGRELSAVQHAMNVIYGSADGEEVFATEYQMQPRRATLIYDLTFRNVLNAANGLPAFRVPRGCTRLFAAIDVMNSAGLRWTVVAVGADRVAAVIGYGRHPADGAPLFAQADQFPVKQTKVAEAVTELTRELAAMRFASADGGRVYRIGAIGIDAGWMNRVVVTFCAGSPLPVTAMRGVSYQAFVTRTRTGQLCGGIVDATDWAFEKRVESGTYLGFHADFWREQAQRAWLNSPLQPSSLSVYGTPELHLQFAQECVADQLLEKDRTRSGATTWKWARNGANHFGDCVTMCLALAHWKRAYSVGGDIGQEAVAPPPGKTAPAGGDFAAKAAFRPMRARSRTILI